MNEIKKSGTPKESIYYYFPDGKEEQITPAQVIHGFLFRVADRMEETRFYTGSSLTMVAMESATQS